MSRSKKKTPCFTIGCKKLKRDAHRTVRRFKGELKSGCYYKKLYQSYDIIDYRFYEHVQLHNNRKFRELAKVVRDIVKGRVSIDNYNIADILDKLEEYEDSFRYFKK